MKEIRKFIVPDYPLADLVPHPENPRLHDDEAMDESLEETGFTGVIVAQESTKHILDGHGRVKGLLRAGVATADVQFVDVDDELARKIVLSRNRVGDRSGYDTDILGQLLSTMADEGELLGTGYTTDDVDTLLAAAEAGYTAEQEFGGGYAEEEDVQAERKKREAVTKVSQGLREVVLVYTDDDYERVKHLVEAVTAFHNTSSTSESVMVGLTMYVKQLAADGEVIE